MRPELRPYQVVGRDFLAGKRLALLADEMRVGKTPQAILAAKEIGATKILVICPAIAVAQWGRELKRWGDYEVGADVVVLSYDKAKLLQSDLRATRWDVLIVDESHYCKNPSAQRTKMVYAKGGLAWCADRVWALSGTPAPNHAGELYPMLRSFGVTQLNYSEFTRKYCYLDNMFKPLGTRVTRIPELKEMLGTIMLRRKRSDVAPDMPGIDFQFLAVEPDLRGIEHLMRADCATEDTAHLQLTALARLLEEPDAARKVVAAAGDFTIARQYCAYAKVTALANEIAFGFAASLYKKTVVFGFFLKPMHMLAGLLRSHDLKVEVIAGATPLPKRELAQRKFMEGGVDVLICQVIAAGTAIDLSVADHGYFLEQDWVPGNNMQAANRLVSMTKKTPVTFDVVTWNNSPDEAVQRTLARKAAELSKLI